jgi:hypothetical protein
MEFKLQSTKKKTTQTEGDLYDLFMKWVSQDADYRVGCQLKVQSDGSGSIISGEGRRVYVFGNKADAVTWFQAGIL